MVVTDLLLAIDDQAAVKLHNVGIVIAKLVAGSIAANDYVLCHTNPSLRTVLHPAEQTAFVPPAAACQLVTKKGQTFQIMGWASRFVSRK
jgi:hypothetical protein